MNIKSYLGPNPIFGHIYSVAGNVSHKGSYSPSPPQKENVDRQTYRLDRFTDWETDTV